MNEFKNLLMYLNQTEEDVFEGKEQASNRIAFYNYLIEITIQTIVEQSNHEVYLTKQQTQQNVDIAKKLTNVQEFGDQYDWLPSSLSTTKQEAMTLFEVVIEDRYHKLAVQNRDDQSLWPSTYFVSYLMDFHNLKTIGSTLEVLSSETVDKWINQVKAEDDPESFLSYFLTQYQEHNYVFHEPNWIDPATKQVVLDILKQDQQLAVEPRDHFETIRQISEEKCPTMKPLLAAYPRGRNHTPTKPIQKIK